jgi:hypothetical protein
MHPCADWVVMRVCWPQVSAKLDTFQGLGPSFASVCAEYGHARRQVAEVQRTLADFDAVVAELEGSGEQ